MNTLNIANVGYCISEKSGIYIANNFITGFKCHRVDGDGIVTLYTINHNFDIYVHNDRYLDFKVVSKKIITKIIESLRYDINTNVNIDKIIDEVIKDV